MTFPRQTRIVMSQSIQSVRNVYAAFAAGDLPAVLAHLDPGIRWNEAEGFPYSDRNAYVGPDAIVTGVFARLAVDWDGFRVEVGEIVGGDDVVTMFGRYKAKRKATGKVLDVQCAHTWWSRDGKAVRFQQMVDTAGVARALA
jgi:ketosteroid isomerase-like protein